MAPKVNRKNVPPPPYRRLRAFAFDPILSRSIETHEINEVTIRLPWEDNVKLGPVDDYIEVVDYDPASQIFYAPVDLNDDHLLAQDGLPPSEGNPQFHQQMVFAVARNTIRHFERALGRRALWSPRLINVKKELKHEFVRRLRIYPHALREANAYYSPVKKALLFGYFPASSIESGENLPGGMVFTCLSHDIVAHETAHALLDGLHRRFIEPSNVDVWALHEAFADIVALFQHFSYPEVLRHQIAQTRGNLKRQNLLTKLAYQFGQAVERYGALRDALGEIDPKTKRWKLKEPDIEEILHTTEPHHRGAILVAAVFDAFLTIYKRRIADLLNIATEGSGVLPLGNIHPDLVNRLAKEAAKTAQHILHMCIRALDYCPPVDVDFGDYLRALITADADMVPDDRLNYRLAFIEAFRKRGIYPSDVRNLSEESLLWKKPKANEQKAFAKALPDPSVLRRHTDDGWGTLIDREQIYRFAERNQKKFHRWLTGSEGEKAIRAAKLTLDKNAPPTIYCGEDGKPTLEIHSVRPAHRVGPDGQRLTDLVVEITQRRRGYFDPRKQKEADSDKSKKLSDPDFIFRGGCTLLISLDTAEVRYCIYKRIESQRRLERMRKYFAGDVVPSLRTTYFGDPKKKYFKSICQRDEKDRKTEIEPFALLHRSFEKEEVNDAKAEKEA
jgi:hypothetical protein